MQPTNLLFRFLWEYQNETNDHICLIGEYEDYVSCYMEGVLLRVLAAITACACRPVHECVCAHVHAHACFYSMARILENDFWNVCIKMSAATSYLISFFHCRFSCLKFMGYFMHYFIRQFRWSWLCCLLDITSVTKPWIALGSHDVKLGLSFLLDDKI